MKISIPKERRPNERRVAGTPDTVRKLKSIGAQVAVESGAGLSAYVSDAAYRDAGAEVVAEPSVLLAQADVVLRVAPPLTSADGGPDEIAMMREGAVVIGLLAPYAHRDHLNAYAARRITAFALELLPRISRAQSMDALSSQSNLAGYRAVLDAAAVYGRAIPMMMTAAGTVAPARVFVLGAGVAGLQAIATARRLGAIVSATDVRPVAREQVESLGASFVMVDDAGGAESETAGGYAREMDADYRRRQAALIREHLKRQDIVVCTALIPGKSAPTLVDDDMVASMRAGSVIVDLAVESGGNCTLSRPGEVVDVGGVTVIGHVNVPSRLAADSSALYARNLLSFLTPMVDPKSGALAIDWQDEIVTGTALTREGAVVHPGFSAQGG
jgi:NAD(P) transhydrogenase subunit alpha